MSRETRDNLVALTAVIVSIALCVVAFLLFAGVLDAGSTPNWFAGLLAWGLSCAITNGDSGGSA